MAIAHGDIERFHRRGWIKLRAAEDVLAWVAAARPLAEAAVLAPENRACLTCGGTWFTGVNVLPNDATGAVVGAAFPGSILAALAALGCAVPGWDRAQISVIYPGYPQPEAGESAAAFGFRKNRDAAHVDGLLPIGAMRRRMLREVHGFVLGIPMTETSADASPLVVWEGSHRHVATAFRRALAAVPMRDWQDTDLTQVYQTTRRAIFETCARVAIHALPGEAYLIHRRALHGVAPWGDAAIAPSGDRMIAYFRPELPGSIADWLADP